MSVDASTQLFDPTAVAPQPPKQAPSRRDDAPAGDTGRGDQVDREPSARPNDDRSVQDKPASDFNRQLDHKREVDNEAQDGDQVETAAPTTTVDNQAETDGPQELTLMTGPLVLPHLADGQKITLDLSLDNLDQATPDLPPLLLPGEGEGNTNAGQDNGLATALANGLNQGDDQGGDQQILANAAMVVSTGANQNNTNAHGNAALETMDGEQADSSLMTTFTTVTTDADSQTTNSGNNGFDFAGNMAEQAEAEAQEQAGLQKQNQGSADFSVQVMDNETEQIRGEISAATNRGPAAMQANQTGSIDIKPTTTANTEMNAADRAVANQITRAVMTQLTDGQRILSLRLTPPELGTVRVEIIEQAGRVQVSMSAEDEGVRAALERALPSMRQDLRSSDTPVSDLQLIDEHFHFHHNEQQRDQAQQQGDGQSNPDDPGATFSLDGKKPEEKARPIAPTLGGDITSDSVDAHA